MAGGGAEAADAGEWCDAQPRHVCLDAFGPAWQERVADAVQRYRQHA